MKKEDKTRYDWIVVVTNDLTHDRRMIRTCRTLTDHGLNTLLIGRELEDSKPLQAQPFHQKRVICTFNRGYLFYVELLQKILSELKRYNFRNLLLTDLDTVGILLMIKNRQQINICLDLHEYFEQVPELETNRLKRYIWNMVGRLSVPKVNLAYTVNETLAKLFSQKYDIPFSVIRNVPPLSTNNKSSELATTKIKTVYLGVLNPGRGLEEIIMAIKNFPHIELHIFGDGPMRLILEQMAAKSENISFYGFIAPSEIRNHIKFMHYGWNLLYTDSLSYFYSLANKFFDYIHHLVVPITMDFPEYRKITDRYRCGYLVPSLSVRSVKLQLEQLSEHFPHSWHIMTENCRKCAEENNWELESKNLISLLVTTQKD